MTLLIIWNLLAVLCMVGTVGIKVERNKRRVNRPVWYRVHTKYSPKQVRL